MTELESITESFDDFRACYKPHVRPDGTLDRMRRALVVDVEFLAEFQLLRPYLRRYEKEWSAEIVQHVTQARSAQGVFDQQSAGAFAYLYKRHSNLLIGGQFDESYLSSVEDVALFMVYKDIKSVWMAGAYQRILTDLISFIFARTENHRIGKMEKLVKVVSRTITIEMNQVQRVFSVYENHRLRALVDDLKEGGYLRAAVEEREPEMTLVTAEHMALVRESFAKVAPHAELFARKFFALLFEKHPQLRSMFSADLTEQRAKFTRTLSVLIDGLDKVEAIMPELEALGRRHSEYGATSEHYEAVGEVMLITLERSLGPSWSGDIREAWKAVYGALANTMISAANRAASENAQGATASPER